MLFSGPWDWIGFYALICFPHICHRLLLCVELWIVIHSLIDRWLVERSSTTVPLGEKKDIGKKHVEIFPFKNDLYNFNRTTNKYWCPFLTWASKYSKPFSPLPFLKNVLVSIEEKCLEKWGFRNDFQPRWTQSEQKLIFLMAFSFCLDFPKGRLPDSKLLINFSGSFWTFSCVIGGWGQNTVQNF